MCMESNCNAELFSIYTYNVYIYINYKYINIILFDIKFNIFI